MSLRRLLLSASLALATLSSAANAADAAPAEHRAHPAKPSFPSVTLAAPRSQGEQAIGLLGQRLPEVAAWYGKSPEEMRSLLRKDRLLRVDGRGRLFVEDQLLAPLGASPAQQTVLDGTLLPLDQTFLLHSKPGSQRTIYLNFKGATLNNTAWGSNIVAKPFDLDGVPGTFNTTELQRIQYIWQRVAEDFAPFDVDVTTEAPAPEALTRSSGTDQVFGTTVLITDSNGVYACSCGGVAYIGVFDDTSDFYKPALVFYNQLGSGNEKYVAEAISHEAGHNMGLQHDGYSGGGYYPGHGSGATGWAPIMGVGYYQALVQWSKGEYATANNTQDDYTVMASNGLVQRTDDHGNTIATATLLSGSASGGSTVFQVQGIIERPSDVDMFGFSAAAGSVTVALNPAARSANLDAQIQLLNASGTVLATANPVDALTASLTFTLPSAGSYYVSVRGVGKGDPLSTGYTNYGSLGNYAVTITAATSSNLPPSAALSATPTSGTVPLVASFSAAGSSDPDGSIASYEWTFGDGSTATGATASHTYSTAGTYTASVKVTDNLGLSSTRSVTITANPVVVAAVDRVGNIAMSLSSTSLTTRVRSYATVTVTDRNGKPVPNATVSGNWSGIVSGAASGTTSSTGVIRIGSPTTRSRGTFTFTVGNVSAAGYTYDGSLNIETSDSITR
ncbi:MAG: PKD domain-containing protein [Rubrivivax sp.]